MIWSSIDKDLAVLQTEKPKDSVPVELIQTTLFNECGEDVGIHRAKALARGEGKGRRASASAGGGGYQLVGSDGRTAPRAQRAEAEVLRRGGCGSSGNGKRFS